MRTLIISCKREIINFNEKEKCANTSPCNITVRVVSILIFYCETGPVNLSETTEKVPFLNAHFKKSTISIYRIHVPFPGFLRVYATLNEREIPGVTMWRAGILPDPVYHLAAVLYKTTPHNETQKLDGNHPSTFV